MILRTERNGEESRQFTVDNFLAWLVSMSGCQKRKSQGRNWIGKTISNKAPHGLHAGLPFVILNTLCGAYAAYGLAGLQYEWRAILIYGVIIVLQSIIAIQLMIFCVYLTPNQVSLTRPLVLP